MKNRFRRMLFDLAFILSIVFVFFALVTFVNGAECSKSKGCGIVAVEAVILEKVKERIQDRREQRLECKDDGVKRPVVKKLVKRVRTVEKFRGHSFREFFSHVFRRN